MAIGREPARDCARKRAMRARRREAAFLNRRADRILNRRALGDRVEKIAADLGFEVQEVRETVSRHRKGGDPRALTDYQCSALARREAAERTQTQALVEAVEIQAALDAAVLRSSMPAQPERPERLAKADRLRDMAARYRTKQPAASAGLMHLADLYEHHATGYPSLRIISEGVTVSRYLPELAHSPIGSPALACLDG